MARIPDQPLLRGTIGNLIYYSVGGRQYVRSKPARVRQPDTPEQLLARDRFRQSSKLAKALSRACPVLGTDENQNATKSAYHTLLGVLRTSPFVEGKEPARWVWEQLMIRNGEAPEVDLNSYYNTESSQLELKWNPQARGASEDKVLLVTGIHTASLKVVLHRLPVRLGRSTIETDSGVAWYMCVLTPGAVNRISGSQFIVCIDESEE